MILRGKGVGKILSSGEAHLITKSNETSWNMMMFVAGKCPSTFCPTLATPMLGGRMKDVFFPNRFELFFQLSSTVHPHSQRYPFSFFVNFIIFT